MNKFIVFRPEERELLETISNFLDMSMRSHDLNLVQNNVDSLNSLAFAISKYPSVLGENSLANRARSISTLVNRLCKSDKSNIVLNTPTKAILGKSYTIAKLNFFVMLGYLVKNEETVSDFESFLHDIIREIVFSLMAEEVMFELVADNQTPVIIKEEVVYKLAELWEYRLDYGVKSFAPALQNIWAARGKLLPAYGTMLGTSEMMQFTAHTDESLIDFFDDVSEDHRMSDSMEEFLFGIVYEDLVFLRSKMNAKKLTAIGKKEIAELLEGRDYKELDSDYNPKQFYEFFVTRNSYAKYRERAGIGGPYKTLEEYLMLYLLKNQLVGKSE